ncbi:DUF998 domain-containing protein [Rhodococcus sp. ABRD24]|uniref:DUF998 domain-containing protein n=1 Tax=Rhodococcus sp. ABRD24 TaxID=2507582 RepID=UPI00103F31FC|nr:DUF998 domain-containing protein [Rhodococcus sp. ABRD24]QBJ97636.1 DUF998 domain-containing protein [Rhodococcus sp. ABRD24]
MTARLGSLPARRLSPWLLVASVQFFVCEFLVAGTWRGRYSYRENYVSDLMVPFCGPDGSDPCSRTAVVFRASVVLVGLAFLVAAWAWRGIGAIGSAGAAYLSVAGLGAVVTGVARPDTSWIVHSVGATLFFLFGSLACVTIALSARDVVSGALSSAVPSISGWIGATLVCGVVGAASYFCYSYGWDGGLGIGGMERLGGYATVLGFVGCMQIVRCIGAIVPGVASVGGRDG